MSLPCEVILSALPNVCSAFAVLNWESRRFIFPCSARLVRRLACSARLVRRCRPCSARLVCHCRSCFARLVRRCLPCSARLVRCCHPCSGGLVRICASPSRAAVCLLSAPRPLLFSSVLWLPSPVAVCPPHILSVDCDIFAVKFMELWDKNIDLRHMFDQSDIPNIRVKLAVDLFFSKGNSIDKSLVMNFYKQGIDPRVCN
ncbi:uncharacterized protein [Miscanthus floridulus]|uniref:uncharacterized protein n=1 Tax=Miscanthus floridulus TaxID=154761 RepID=UPI00345765AB